MRVRLLRRFTVQPRQYESYAFGADVEVTHHDLGYTDDQVAAMTDKEWSAMAKEMRDLGKEQLFKLLGDEVEEAADLIPNKKSFIFRALEEGY